jgi:hypothetical protein
VIFILDHVTITSVRRKQMAAEDKSTPLAKGYISLVRVSTRSAVLCSVSLWATGGFLDAVPITKSSMGATIDIPQREGIEREAQQSA